MRIKLSPTRTDDVLEVSKRSDVLTINGERYDFRPLPEGAVLPLAAINCRWIVSDVTRVNGELVLTLAMPVGAAPSDQARFPTDLVNPANGNLRFPE